MANLRVKLQRLWMDENQSTGVLTVFNDKGQPIFAALSIERGDRDNQKNVSNIPSGTYPLVWEFSPKFNRKLYEIKDVPNRSEAKIHPANMWQQLNGCIAIGNKLKDINDDGYYDVLDSRNTIDAFHDILKGISITTIEIINPL